jgi:hypothetical protein
VTSTDEHPLVVFGCFLAIGWVLLLLMIGTHQAGGCPFSEASFEDRTTNGFSACDDYAPVAPRDGSWCGVRLDDRFPVRDDSFPVADGEP